MSESKQIQAQTPCQALVTPWPTRRQYFSHDGPGWDYRIFQPDYNWDTNEVDSDAPAPGIRK